MHERRHPAEVFLARHPNTNVDYAYMSQREWKAMIARGELALPVSPKPITHLNDALLSQLMCLNWTIFWFTAKDGVKVQGFLIPPPGFDASKKYPVKFLIHGGPQGAWGDSWSYRWNPNSSPPTAT